MTAGDKELRQAFENTTNKNLKSMLQHGNDSRKIVRGLEEKIERLEAQVRQQNERFNELDKTLAVIQGKMYAILRPRGE